MINCKIGFPFSVGSELPTVENGDSFPDNLVVLPVLKGQGYSIGYLSLICALPQSFDWRLYMILQLALLNFQRSMAGGQVHSNR